ncbi:MAG: hypothetical protein Q9181_008120, partial [Wetmoreana brouardii]
GESGTPEVAIYPLPDSRTFFIDTPGFEDSQDQRSDTDILQSIASCMADLKEGLTFKDHAVDLSGIIYVHAINEVRMTGSMMKNLKMLRHLAGKENMRNLTFVTSKWGIEDKGVAEDREKELMTDPEFWKEPLAAGATMRRFEDTRQSALDIVKQATRNGTFTPKLTREYVLEGKALYQTSAGRAIDDNLAKAREQQEDALETLRREHLKALKTRTGQGAETLRLQALQLEAKLNNVEDELQQLRLGREEDQERMDKLDSLSVGGNHGILKWADRKAEKRKTRQMRAVRWFARFAALGAAVAISVLSHGAMVPVGLTLVGGVENLCQEYKRRHRREGEKRRRMLKEESVGASASGADVADGTMRQLIEYDND